MSSFWGAQCSAICWKKTISILQTCRTARVEPKSYKFNRPWGVPVRYHDFAEYNHKIRPDVFEFHLSYSDLDLNISEFLSGEYECGFVVHAPELFSGSRLMDLASPDEEYRQYSVKETQRVIDITRALEKILSGYQSDQ